MENVLSSYDGLEGCLDRLADRQECLSYKSPNTTMPHGVNCMAQWGRTGKLRILIIVGSGA